MDLRIRAGTEFTAVVVLTAAFICAVALVPSNLLRIILGLLFLLLCPGYSLTTALFPRKSDLRGSERLALTFGLSIALASLVGLLLNYTWGVRLWPSVAAITILVIAASAVALYRRGHLPQEERWIPHVHVAVPAWRKGRPIDRLLYLLVALSLVTAAGLIAYRLAIPASEQKFTEFYVLGPAGQMRDYPETLTVGEEASAALGIVCQEHSSTSYRVEIWVDKGQDTEEQCAVIGPIELCHDEEWEQEAVFAIEQPGEDRKVEFWLFRNNETQPCRTLHLWVDVTQ